MTARRSLDTPVPGPVGPFAMLVVSETEVGVYAGCWEFAPAEWKALCAWCEAHGMDPKAMPVDQVIVRNIERCRVEYDVFEFDSQGRRIIEKGDPMEPETWVCAKARVHAQGETPPMPFPDVILAHLRPPETA